MKTDSLKSFDNFYKSLGVKDASVEDLCMKIWNESRLASKREEDFIRDEENKKSRELREKLYYLQTQAIPDCVFVERNFGNKYVRNQSYGYFRKEKWVVIKEDGHSGWYGSSASFNGFEIEEYEIEQLECRRLPEPPQKIDNLYFLDDLVFRRDILHFRFGDMGRIKRTSKYLPHRSGELDKEEITKIERLIKGCKCLSPYSYRFDGEPCYTPIRHALPPHLRKYKEGYYHNEIDNRMRYPFSDKMKWQYCPIKIKVKMVKLWIKARRAAKAKNYDLEEKLKRQSEDLFPNKVNKPNDISLNQWKTMSKIAKLNTTAGAINEYHKSN